MFNYKVAIMKLKNLLIVGSILLVVSVVMSSCNKDEEPKDCIDICGAEVCKDAYEAGIKLSKQQCEAQGLTTCEELYPSWETYKKQNTNVDCSGVQ